MGQQIWIVEDTQFFSYYERTEDSDFKWKEDSTEIHNMAEAEDYFTRYLSYKFSISFKIFSDEMPELSEDVDDYYLNSNYKEMLQELSLCQKQTLKSLYERYNTYLETK